MNSESPPAFTLRGRHPAPRHAALFGEAPPAEPGSPTGAWACATSHSYQRTLSHKYVHLGKLVNNEMFHFPFFLQT